MSGSFQAFTNSLQAPGVAGDFASANPRAVALSSQQYNSAGFRAGPNGLTIGLFAWLDPSSYTFASNNGAGAPTGFVHRNQQALITTYLSAYGMTIPAGMMVGDLFVAGDFFVVNNGTTQAIPGQKAYANNTNGTASFAASGAPATSGTSTASTVSAQTAAVTASVANNIMTVTAVASGILVPGGVLTTGSGPALTSGTIVISQIDGTPGGIGHYVISPQEQTIASVTINETYGLLTVGGTVAGTFAVGQALVGATGTITGLGTASGGAGTYYTQTQTVASGSISSLSNTETGWYARSFAQPGELVKITSQAMG